MFDRQLVSISLIFSKRNPYTFSSNIFRVTFSERTHLSKDLFPQIQSISPYRSLISCNLVLIKSAKIRPFSIILILSPLDTELMSERLIRIYIPTLLLRVPFPSVDTRLSSLPSPVFLPFPSSVTRSVLRARAPIRDEVPSFKVPPYESEKTEAS